MATEIEKRNAKRGFTVATLKAKAARYGATVDHGSPGKWEVCNIDAPAGKVWSCASIHALVVEWQQGDPAWRNSAIVDALERMECGLADCDNADCDYCHPEAE